MAYTDPSDSGSMDVAEGAVVTKTIWDYFRNNFLAIAGTAGKPILDKVTAALGGDVTMTNANTDYDGPNTGALAIGTWLVTACITAYRGNAGYFEAKIWDGSTVYASGEATIDAAGGSVQIALAVIITLAAPATIKVSAACTAAGSTLKAATVSNGAGNNASTISAVRIT